MALSRIMEANVSRVMEGIGKGSLFGYGRICGVHNPFSKTKSSDPFINLLTLARYSNYGTHEQKKAVMENITARMKAGLSDDEVNFIFENFSAEVLMSALTRNTFEDYYVHNAIMRMLAHTDPTHLTNYMYRKMLVNLSTYPDKCIFGHGDEPTYSASYVAKNAFFKLDSMGIKPDEIDHIAQRSKVPSLLRMIIHTPRTSRQTLLRLANREIENMDDSLNVEAYDVLAKSLMTDEMAMLTESPSRTVINKLLAYPQATPTVIAKIVLRLTPKTRPVIDREEAGHYETVEETVDGAQGTGVCLRPSSVLVSQCGWVVDSPMESHVEYSANDALHALELIASRGEQISKIITAISAVERELGTEMANLFITGSVNTADHPVAIRMFRSAGRETQVDMIARFARARIELVNSLINKVMPEKMISAVTVWNEIMSSDVADGIEEKIIKLFPELEEVAQKIAEHFRTCYAFWAANFLSCDENGQIGPTSSQHSSAINLTAGEKGRIDRLTGMHTLGNNISKYAKALSAESN